MSEDNPYLQHSSESIADWTKRLDGVDTTQLSEHERLQLEMARRGIPPRRPK
jgi:hypothetical protein